MAQTAQIFGADAHPVFFWGREDLPVELIKVREIMGMREITPGPRGPALVKSFFNLRGEIISLLDLRAACPIEERHWDERSLLMIVEADTPIKSLTVGLVVDQFCLGCPHLPEVL